MQILQLPWGMLMPDNQKYGKLKRTQCSQCNAKLTGKRTRFCSDTCSSIFDAERSRMKHDLLRSHIKDKECISCGDTYTPRTFNQVCCSKNCRSVLTAKQRREKRAEKELLISKKNLNFQQYTQMERCRC